MPEPKHRACKVPCPNPTIPQKSRVLCNTTIALDVIVMKMMSIRAPLTCHIVGAPYSPVHRSTLACFLNKHLTHLLPFNSQPSSFPPWTIQYTMEDRDNPAARHIKPLKRSRRALQTPPIMAHNPSPGSQNSFPEQLHEHAPRAEAVERPAFASCMSSGAEATEEPAFAPPRRNESNGYTIEDEASKQRHAFTAAPGASAPSYLHRAQSEDVSDTAIYRDTAEEVRLTEESRVEAEDREAAPRGEVEHMLLAESPRGTIKSLQKQLEAVTKKIAEREEHNKAITQSLFEVRSKVSECRSVYECKISQVREQRDKFYEDCKKSKKMITEKHDPGFEIDDADDEYVQSDDEAPV